MVGVNLESAATESSFDAGWIKRPIQRADNREFLHFEFSVLASFGYLDLAGFTKLVATLRLDFQVGDSNSIGIKNLAQNVSVR